MSEAFDGVNAFCWAHAADPGASPDEAHDCIYMMEPADWAALRDAWRVSPSGWREGCAYVLGLGPAGECLPLLEQALQDSDSGVVTEAATGYAGLILETNAVQQVPTSVHERLTQIIATHGAAHLEEVASLLEQPRRIAGPIKD